MTETADPHTTSSSAGELEITPCGRGADSYACGGCDCGLETRQVRRLRLEVSSLQDQIAHLTGYADGLKRGSDLHEQRRGELEKQVAEISKHDVCTDRLITTLRERDEARAQLTAQAERVAYWQRNAEPSGESVNAVIEAARKVIRPYGDQRPRFWMDGMAGLRDALARLGDAADVPAGGHDAAS